jgi:hypothetical protein
MLKFSYRRTAFFCSVLTTVETSSLCSMLTIVGLLFFVGLTLLESIIYVQF